MFDCPLTDDLPRLLHHTALLDPHVARCPCCCSDVPLLRASKASTPGPCPELRDLESLVQNQLPLDEATELLRHVASCPACQAKLDQIRGADPLPDEPTAIALIAQADRALDAHNLAEDLAAWLSSEPYPREETAVKEQFDTVYSAAKESLESPTTTDANQREVETVGLAFSGQPGITVAQRIIQLSALVAHLRSHRANSEQEVAELLDGMLGELQAAGFSAKIVMKAVKHLRSKHY